MIYITIMNYLIPIIMDKFLIYLMKMLLIWSIPLLISKRKKIFIKLLFFYLFRNNLINDKDSLKNQMKMFEDFKQQFGKQNIQKKKNSKNYFYPAKKIN